MNIVLFRHVYGLHFALGRHDLSPVPAVARKVI